jgi:eukaryotic-like serine/threonine-protein kinase
MIELSAGSILGHYKIIRRLGQGGMGEVYEAEDQKLGRRVAIKVLPEAMRNDTSALERFWREARAASSLNHPGICTIHELNESAETPFIVMELLEGSSLEKVYHGKAMPFGALLELGIQVSDALDAAHRKGILHRDIKPANIFLTKSGQAKILDFGLAKLEESAGEGVPDLAATQAPATMAYQLTNPGSSLGTVAYMSPEQARGEQLDVRSDVFSLGVVLYEVATGKPPFAGSTTAVVFDRILNYAPVAPVDLNPELPVEFENILNKTLEKDRDLRCQSAAELRADLKRLQRSSGSGRAAASGLAAMSSGGSGAGSKGSSSGGGVAVRASSGGRVSNGAFASSSGGATAPVSDPPPAAKKSHAPIWIGAVVVLLGLVGIVAWHFWPKPVPFASFGLHQMTESGNIEAVAMSPDGRYLAEVKNDKGQRTLWVRNIPTNTDAQVLPAFTNPYVGLAFSPDGNSLYFVRGTEKNVYIRDLYQISVLGGTPRQIVHNVDSPPSFSPDGSRMVFLRQTPELKDHFTELHIADRDGANDQLVYTDSNLPGYPVWSPDGSAIELNEQLRPGALVMLLDVATKKITQLKAPSGISYGIDAAWMPDSRHVLLTYVRENSDRAQIASVSVPGNQFQALTNDLNSYEGLALSSNGKTMATVLTNRDTNLSLYKGGGGALVSSVPLRISAGRLSWLDEKRMVVLTPRVAISKLDPTTGAAERIDVGDLQLAASMNSCPDGRIVFPGIPKALDHTRLYRMNTDGSGQTALTTDGVVRDPVCLTDGKTINFAVFNDKRTSGWSVPLEGGAAKKLFDGEGGFPIRFSQDGRYAIHQKATSDESESLVWVLRDLTANSVRDITPDVRFSFSNTTFLPDSKALVYGIQQGGGEAILVHPLDGSPSHVLVDFVPSRIRDFAWSPSGDQLAVLREHSTSDVVLITDQDTKAAH